MSGVNPYIAELCRLFVLITLIAAVAGKLKDMESFKSATGDLLDISQRNAGPAAYAAIAAEGCVAALLILGGDYARIAMGAAIPLFLAFTAVIAVALAGRRRVSCNCFGGRDETLSPYDLVRNAVLIVAAAYFLILPPASPAPVFAIVLLIGVGIPLFLVSTSLRDIFMLLRVRQA